MLEHGGRIVVCQLLEELLGLLGRMVDVVGLCDGLLGLLFGLGGLGQLGFERLEMLLHLDDLVFCRLLGRLCRIFHAFEGVGLLFSFALGRVSRLLSALQPALGLIYLTLRGADGGAAFIGGHLSVFLRFGEPGHLCGDLCPEIGQLLRRGLVVVLKVAQIPLQAVEALAGVVHRFVCRAHAAIAPADKIAQRVLGSLEVAFGAGEGPGRILRRGLGIARQLFIGAQVLGVFCLELIEGLLQLGFLLLGCFLLLFQRGDGGQRLLDDLAVLVDYLVVASLHILAMLHFLGARLDRAL